MALRSLVAVLIGLAVALAPLGMPAMAAAPAASHHGDMAGQRGHCDQPTQPDRHHKAADKGCCAAMCLGIAVAPASAEPFAFAEDALRPGLQLFRRGIPTELPTPPPKAA